MGHKLVPDPFDERLARLAARQHGVVSRAQLVDLGLSGSAMAKRSKAGRLHRLHRGVYAVGHARVGQRGRFMAAVLACGPGAVLSHASAAALWELPWWRGPRIDVTVPSRGGRARRSVLVIHRAVLPAQEATTKDGIQTTSPSRTLIDLADYGRKRSLERALDEANYLKLDLSDLAPRHGRRGSGLLAAVLTAHEPGTTRTRSMLEERLLALCERQDLPRPQVNIHIEGYEADFVWPEQRLIVETDGRASHGTRAAFEHDRLRDADLTVAGWRVIRITDRRLGQEPGAVAAQLGRLLSSPG